MARALSFADVRKAALSLPDAEEASSHGLTGFRQRGKLFLVFREKLEAIVLRASFEQRDAMIAEDPETYFTNDHYRGYPWVLARLARLNAKVLPDLLQMALLAAPPPKAARKAKRK